MLRENLYLSGHVRSCQDIIQLLDAFLALMCVYIIVAIVVKRVSEYKELIKRPSISKELVSEGCVVKGNKVNKTSTP